MTKLSQIQAGIFVEFTNIEMIQLFKWCLGSDPRCSGVTELDKMIS